MSSQEEQVAQDKEARDEALAEMVFEGDEEKHLSAIIQAAQEKEHRDHISTVQWGTDKNSQARRVRDAESQEIYDQACVPHTTALDVPYNLFSHVVSTGQFGSVK